MRSFPLFLLLALFVPIYVINKKVSNINSKLSDIEIILQRNHKESNEISSKNTKLIGYIQNALLAEKVEQITASAKTDQDKCIKIAQWITLNISDRDDPLDADNFESFSFRTGWCAHRALLFIHMLTYINIPAKKFNIYNYSGGNHSCIQAYYANKWHFFDPTYAGYFIKDSVVLSFNEIMEEAKKGNHLDLMIVLSGAIDKSPSPVLQNRSLIESQRKIGTSYGELVDNEKRMKDFYADLKTAKTFGFLDTDLKTIYVDFDSKRFHNDRWTIGSDSKGYQEMESQAIKQNLPEFLGQVGNCTDNFQYHWNFTNLKVGKTYTLQFDGNFNFTSGYQGDNQGIANLKVSGTDIEILDGREAKLSEKIWKIIFKPLKKDGSLSITPLITMKDVKGCFYVHKIQLSCAS